MEPETVIYYAPGRGLAGPVRLLLSYVGRPFREVSLESPEHLAALRAEGVFCFDQIPGYAIDGLRLAETPAVLRYLARAHDLEGDGPTDAVHADMLVERLLALRTEIAYAPFDPDPEAAREALLSKAAKELARIEGWLAGLGATPPFAVGARRTYADLVLFDALRWLLELAPAALAPHPTLAAVFEDTGADPRVRDHYASPRAFPPPDDAYVAHMRWVFGLADSAGS